MGTRLKKGRVRQAPGQVDYENLGKRPEFVQWRTLHNERTGATVHMFGMSGKPKQGPWTGYTETKIHEAPCVHCGQDNVYTKGKMGYHLCSGHFALPDSQGNYVPCGYKGLTNDAGEHVCVGRPSMTCHKVEIWHPLDGWREQ